MSFDSLYSLISYHRHKPIPARKVEICDHAAFQAASAPDGYYKEICKVLLSVNSIRQQHPSESAQIWLNTVASTTLVQRKRQYEP